ncbi:MAG: DUF1552 domain-containing protein [Polyangiaceae bacterium]
MSRKTLSRRAVLRGVLASGAAITVGLPMLESMLNSNGTALAGGDPIPQRFLTYFFGNGFLLPRFVPVDTGPNYTLSEQLQPLAPIKDYCSVITGMNNLCEKLITHHEGITIFTGATMVNIQGLSSNPGGPTIDQLVADAIEASGVVTPVKSIQMGISRQLSYMDGGTTMHNLSHRGPNQPLPPEFSPNEVWNNLFGSFTPMNDPSGPLRMSVLDAVKDQTAALKKRLGQTDKQRLDAHLEGVNELEKKLEAVPPVCQAPGIPGEDNPPVNGPEPIIKVNQLMADLLAYAFECDVTRVASVLLVGGAAGTVLYDIGTNNEHHLATHNGQASVQNGIVHNGIVYQMQRFSDFLQTLKNKTDPTGGNLLDNTICFFSSDCAEGYTHSVQKQPMIVAGKGGGYLKYPGIHYASAGGNPSDVLLTVLQAFNPAATSVGQLVPGPNSNKAPGSTSPFLEIKA